jgi:hypothetical protein
MADVAAKAVLVLHIAAPPGSLGVEIGAGRAGLRERAMGSPPW